MTTIVPDKQAALARSIPGRVANQLDYLANDVVNSELNLAFEKVVKQSQSLACDTVSI